MQKPSLTLARCKGQVAHLMSRRLWVLPFASVVIVITCSLFFPGKALAVAATPGQPTSMSGTSGNQQASLSWGQATGATGYLVNETDLVTGQTVQLSTVVTTTSTTV